MFAVKGAAADQSERPAVAVSGLTALVIRALGLLVGKMVKDDRGMADVADVKTVTGVNTMR